ncbi:hypothetical protein F2Q69_00008929 [Brassica cretica]|uniref:Uncharacterized protein n=1 Tax=Brassica cretica TaxID=69181 RepID=A0A8S9P729_BRACR|nr:hypothetical protein F2Q69_00008929 [Brassica cretica]
MKNSVLYSWFLGSANLVNNWAYHGIGPDISYRTVRTRDHMLSFVSSPEKKRDREWRWLFGGDLHSHNRWSSNDSSSSLDGALGLPLVFDLQQRS